MKSAVKNLSLLSRTTRSTNVRPIFRSNTLQTKMIPQITFRRQIANSKPLYNNLMDTGPSFEELSKTPTLAFFKLKPDPSQGAALQCRFMYATKCVFLDAANQKGEKKKPGTEGTQYNWDNKVVIRLSIMELGTMLTVLDGKQSSCEIKHVKRDDKDFNKVTYTSNLIFAAHETGGQYSIKMTKQMGNEVKGDVLITLEMGEVTVLGEFFRNAIRSSLGFF